MTQFIGGGCPCSGRPADSRLQGLATAFWYTPSLANRPRIDDQPTFTARLDVLL